MLHSIIIPHRNRLPQLAACLASINRSAEATGIEDFEIVLVNHGVPEDAHGFTLAAMTPHLRIIMDTDPMPIFNKARLLNYGLKAARGDVITFLDADAIVGERWLEGAEVLVEPERLLDVDPELAAKWTAYGLELAELNLTRLCYRVRTLPRDFAHYPDHFGQPPAECIATAFAFYPDHPRAYEAYITPDFSPPEGAKPDPVQHPVFGNSQFSIPRGTLAALADALPDAPRVVGHHGRPLLAYDPGYVGRGFQDIDYIQAIWHGMDDHLDGYRAVIFTDPEHAMFHVQHPYADDWDPTVTRDGILHHTAKEANAARYRQKWQ